MAGSHESVELIGDRVVEYFATAVLVAALTAGLAQFSAPYPFSPAPVTLQTAGVYAAGLLLGPVWGAFSLLLYLGAGIAGAPVFAGFGAGLGVVTGPTGGYLISFPIAAALIGGIVHRQVDPRSLTDVSLVVQAGALLAGMVVVFLIGSVQLALVMGMDLVTGLIEGGLVFLPGDVAKAVAVLGLLTGEHLVGERQLPGE